MSAKKKSTKKTAKAKSAVKKKASPKASAKPVISKAKPRNSKPTERSWRRRILVLLLKTFLLFVVFLGGYMVYLNYTVVTHFQGKRWALPARVYARPLELYSGLAITPEQLQIELGALRYRHGFDPRKPGTWSRNGNRFQLTTRSFTFWDGSDQSVPVELTFDRSGVSAIRHAVAGAGIDLVRLDPAQIASIYPAHNEDRVLVRLEEVPPSLTAALIAIEDRRFYKHAGVDPLAIGRAMVANLKAGKVVQGGSTLTQQLVKNFYLNQDRNLWRKINEALMALLVDAHYEKNEILESYLNEIYLGQDGQRAIHGFGLASQFYFDRQLDELTIDQQALLVGMVRGASYYNPRRHPDRAQTLRDMILTVLHEQGVISPDELKLAKLRPLGVVKRPPASQSHYPAFIDLVRRQLQEDYREEDIRSEGLQIFTTLSPVAQAEAERALAQQLERHNKPGLEGAVVMTQTGSGEVLAMVGGRKARFSGFNRALDARRQIGSLIKPVVYLTALSDPKSYTLSTLLEDKPFSINDETGQMWAPDNYDRQFHGEVPMVLALANSYNVATARLGLDLGIERVIDTLERLGYPNEVRPYPSLLLGTTEMTPIEVTQIYQTLASGGFKMPLRAIREVLDANRQPLSRYPLNVTQAVDSHAVYLTNRALVEVVAQGTGKGLKHYLSADMAIAGKTGTTNDLKDSWFAGFTGDILGVVWIGNDDNTSMGLTGSSGAMQVWGQMVSSMRPTSLTLPTPEGVEQVWIDLNNGGLSSSWCKNAVQLPFVEGSQPLHESSCSSRGMGGAVDRTMKWFQEVLGE